MHFPSSFATENLVDANSYLQRQPANATSNLFVANTSKTVVLFRDLRPDGSGMSSRLSVVLDQVSSL